MLPGVLNLGVYQGDRYEVFLRIRELIWDEGTETWVPGDYLDLTGYIVKAEIKVNKTQVAPTASFAPTILDQVTTKGGVMLLLTPTESKKLTASSYVWDCEISEDADHVQTFVAGTVTVVAEVTA
jgi:hypothetical protein